MTGALMTLRPALPADAVAVRDLYCRSFTATFAHLYPPEDLAGFLDSCSEARFRDELASPDYAVHLAEAEGRLLGYCTLGPQDLGIALGPAGWVLRQLYLEDDAKGTGLADRLIHWAIDEARARGKAALYLTVWVENHRARRVYERHGFEEVGAYAFRVGTVVDDDRIMRLTL